MARSRLLFIVASLCAHTGAALTEEPRPNVTTWKEEQAEKAAAAEAKVKTEKKKAAIDKAVTLLEGLRTKVAEEGEAEAKTYNAFACFCKETTKEKLEAITKGEDSKEQLSADISELSSKRESLDGTVQSNEESIAACRKDMEAATAQRKEGSQLYQTNNEDLTGAISALESALQRLKASRTPPPPQKEESFLQGNSKQSSTSDKDLQNVLQSTDLLAAVQLADALGLGGTKEGFASFLSQGPEVPMEDYKFKSNDIIGMLEKLLGQFRDEKVETDKTEVESVSTYDKFMEQKKAEIKQKEHNIEVAKAEKAEAEASIGAFSKELTTVEATLKDDKQYASELSDLCRDKAKTWDQRSALRSSELYTLTQALSVIKGAIDESVSADTIRFAQTGATLQQVKALARDPSAMEAIEAAAEAVPSLVQIRRVSLASAKSPEPVEGRTAVVKLLKEQGSKLKSTLLTELAGKLASSADPFAKVKQLIQELIERLMQQATNEANQKGWCDKSIQAAQQKRDYAAEEVRTLNSKMAQMEARRDHLADELSMLQTSISEIKAARHTAITERAQEKEQNEATIEEAKEGLEALTLVVELLDHFYKASAKETVQLSLLSQGPKDDAPDAGFEVGEAYTGAQSESGGILAMLDVMKSDFVRTISETQVAEQKAEEEHLEFMTESGKSLAQKEEAESERKAQHQDVLGKLSEATESFQSHQSIVLTAIKELLELQPVCINTGMSYEDRVANREEEIAALNRAVCILEQYQEYGPEATSSSC